MKPMAFKSAAALVRWIEASMRRMARCQRCRGKGVVLGIGANAARECEVCEGLGVVIA